MVGIGGVSRLSRWLHPRLYRWTGGRGPLGRFLGKRVVLLTTTGVRSGKQRTAPIWAYPEGEAWIVVGSRGGDYRPPGWYFNLRARPEATLEVGLLRIQVRAREVRHGSLEYERRWAMVNEAYPGYAYYRERSGRHIPIMVLEPMHEEVSAPAAG
jgi:deazaflavin-dependent oxidoreductase (nitroreductase family)